jgi:hypothetical protein
MHTNTYSIQKWRFCPIQKKCPAEGPSNQTLAYIRIAITVHNSNPYQLGSGLVIFACENQNDQPSDQPMIRCNEFLFQIWGYLKHPRKISAKLVQNWQFWVI